MFVRMLAIVLIAHGAWTRRYRAPSPRIMQFALKYDF